MPLKKLSHHQYEAVALRLVGLSHREIAEKLHRKEGTIGNWFWDPLVKSELAARRAAAMETAKEKIDMAAPRAADTTIRLLDSKNDFAALGAAQDVLNRAGIRVVNKHEVSGANGEPIKFIVGHLLKNV